jgi:hypothetical protein
MVIVVLCNERFYVHGWFPGALLLCIPSPLDEVLHVAVYLPSVKQSLDCEDSVLEEGSSTILEMLSALYMYTFAKNNIV